MSKLSPIVHHPDDELISAYAAGTLDEASSLALATHLTLCPQCRGDFTSYEALGAALLEEVEPSPMGAGAFAATLARARSSAVDRTARPVQKPTNPTLFPIPLQSYVGGDLDAVRWKALGPGIHHMPLINAAGTTARLLRIAPGKAVFEHSHQGNELTLVLRGSYDAGGERYARGDLEMADASISHRPVAGHDDICVCLAVTDAPLRFGNLLGRLMQPFIGI